MGNKEELIKATQGSSVRSTRRERLVLATQGSSVRSTRRERLVLAANDYYNGRLTGLSDQEYDELLRSEKEFDPTFNIFDYVHYEGQFSKAKHSIKIPVWSKSTDWNLMKTLFEEYVVTPKFDGCSIVAYYLDGKLNNIITRSNEIEGVVQTEKLKNKVPQEVDSKVKAVLCEAVCVESRQKANGLINSKYKQDEVDELLTLMPFDVITTIPMTYIERFKLANLRPLIITPSQAEEIRDKYTCYFNGIGDVPCDGLVGYSDIYPTRPAQILKLYGVDFADTVITKVQPILSYDSMTFSLTYWFNPVELGGSTIKKVGNAGSYKTCREKMLGLGSKVQVRLAKQVIPQIKSSEEWDEKLDQTIYCPYCGDPLVEFEGKLICKNSKCSSILDYFAHKYIRFYQLPEPSPKGSKVIDKTYIPLIFDKAKSDLDFKWYLIAPPRLRSPLTQIQTNDEIVRYVNTLSKSQQRYFKMITKRLVNLKEMKI